MNNPYVVGQWVRGERFYGRSALIDEILDGPRNSLWVLGTRRIGKTSLLKQLEHLTSTERREYLPIFWDFQGADDPQELDLSDNSITENTRFSYPLTCNPNVMEGAKGGQPQTIVLLTADAFGVLPPVSVLEGKDVMYHFVQGFTAKLAGTEVGITEPKAAFSACFGSCLGRARRLGPDDPFGGLTGGSVFG